MAIDISVIIPMYNAGQCIARTLHSIEKQTFGGTYEVIVVDDGSKDDGVAVVEELQQQYPNIRLVKKENGGVSSARNCGMDNAEGKYIAFVDADDMVEDYYLAAMYEKAEAACADVVVGCVIWREGRQRINKSLDDMPEEGNFADIFNYIDNRNFTFSVCAKLYRAEVIKRNEIRFDERFSKAEDCLFNYDVYTVTQRVALIKQSGYVYIVTAGSLMSKYDPHHVETSLLMMQRRNVIRQRIGMSAQEIKEIGDSELADMAFSFLKIMFCTAGAPTLSDCVKQIRADILNRADVMQAVSNTPLTKRASKLQRAIILIRNAWFIAVAHKVLYALHH